jgi:tyrosinase
MATRKSVAALSSAERIAYVDAVKKLKAAPSQFTPPTTGRYDDYVYVHMQAMLELAVNDTSQPVANGNWTITSDMRMPMWAHRCPAFLPWHREFLYQFERDLQSVSGSSDLGIPYWDWSVDQAQDKAPWLADFLGGDGADGPVATGPFAGSANWKLNLSEDGVDHLVRGFGLLAGFSRLPTPAEVNTCFSESRYDAAPWNDTQTLESFRNQLEGWHVAPGSDVTTGMHNLVHLWVGGNLGSMLPSTSPNDPVFFLHHCNVDRLWTIWQQHNPAIAHYLPGVPIPSDPGQGLNEPMIFFDPTLSSTPPWSDPPATPSNVIDHHGLGYIYDFEAPVTPRPAELALVTPMRRRVAMAARDRFRVRLENAQ